MKTRRGPESRPHLSPSQAQARALFSVNPRHSVTLVAEPVGGGEGRRGTRSAVKPNTVKTQHHAAQSSAKGATTTPNPHKGREVAKGASKAKGTTREGKPGENKKHKVGRERQRRHKVRHAGPQTPTSEPLSSAAATGRFCTCANAHSHTQTHSYCCG